MQKQKTKKNGVARESVRTKQLCWGSHNPNCSFTLQPLFTPLNFSDSGSNCWHVTRASRWQKSGKERSEWTSFTGATVFTDSVAAAFA